MVLFVMSIADIPTLSVNLVPEAQAFRGRGAAFAVGAAVGSARSSSEASSAAAQQQAAAAQQQAAVAQQQASRRSWLSNRPPPPGPRCRWGPSWQPFLQDVLPPRWAG